MGGMPRRLLFVAGYFPPRGPIGAVRAGKLVEHWRRGGCDVRVIALDLTPEHRGPLGQSDSAVYYLSHRDPGKFVTDLKSRIVGSSAGRMVLGRDTSKTKSVNPKQPQPADILATGFDKYSLLDIYRQYMQFPDSYKSWIKPAVSLAASWQPVWKPDAIYSSGPPHSGQVIAAHLASRFRIPWIAEFRDLWVGDPYFDRHPFINWLHERLAKKTLAKASACVAVTKAAGEYLKAATKLPVAVSYNGFDPEDFAGLENVAPLDRERVTIIHAGIIYPGRRDPTPLLKAIALLPEAARKIRCLFYHDQHGTVATLADRYGVRSSVEIKEAIPRREILSMERRADILLECRWLDAGGDGVIPGKLFEYIGARRPILSLGSLTGESAHIVRDNKLGLASNDPEEIKAMLVQAMSVKAKLGRLPDSDADHDRFRREIQFQKIDELFESTLAFGARTRR